MQVRICRKTEKISRKLVQRDGWVSAHGWGTFGRFKKGNLDLYQLNVLVAVQIECVSALRNGEKKSESRDTQKKSTELGLKCRGKAGLRYNFIYLQFTFIMGSCDILYCLCNWACMLVPSTKLSNRGGVHLKVKIISVLNMFLRW